MKKLLILILALTAGYNAIAQQKPKTNYMIIHIEDDNSKVNMIVTRTDSATVQKHLDLSLKHVKAKDRTAAHDSVMLSMLKTYFDQGWKLVSTSVQTAVGRGSSFPFEYMYYLSKEQQ
jgi:hypothetical protein